ncbi:MAG: glucosaminidase domain-containing protein [Campylobacteraceae bacterium]|nr:glucosaminidase domain-containing protein [Campylobacteraceae bacterium]
MKKILLVLAFSSLLILNALGFPKEYYSLKDTKQMKTYFFNFLYPLIEEENNLILKDRAFILSLKTNKNLEKNSKDYLKLEKLAKTYSVKDMFDYKKLLKKIDIIPPSMALAQAATESGWGKSRFVKVANNIFGHWTYGKVGIVPLRRNKGSKHLIRIFPDLQTSIKAYMQNLNRTRAYSSFRNKRETQRKRSMELQGLALSQTMINYSAIREKYLKILGSIIRVNKLKNYDQKYYDQVLKNK